MTLDHDHVTGQLHKGCEVGAPQRTTAPQNVNAPSKEFCGQQVEGMAHTAPEGPSFLAATRKELIVLELICVQQLATQFAREARYTYPEFL
mmetsp:Transcript_108650/g.187963  ORF Transcript_108650/g.187963 Transcript_108650/m.187963 type:complete len:91 (-) Transcript_108650:712-984(-)